MNHDDCDHVINELRAELAAANQRAEWLDAETLRLARERDAANVNRDQWHTEATKLRERAGKAEARLHGYVIDDEQAVAGLYELRALKAEAERDRLRARLAEIGEEWGIRWTYTDGTAFEGPVADNETRARQILADPEMRENRSDIASMTLIRREITGWREAEAADATGTGLSGTQTASQDTRTPETESNSSTTPQRTQEATG